MLYQLSYLPKEHRGYHRISLAPAGRSGHSGPVEWLPREEVLILLSGLAASALLVLGVLEAIWPTRRHRARRAAEPAVPIHMSAPARVISLEEDRAEVALRVGRTLLARALEDPDPASDQRIRLLCRAIACLDRGLSAAPADARLRETLAAANEALAHTDEQTAIRRLAAEMPWRAPGLALALVSSR